MIAGMISGVLPGLGITSTLILSYPFIKDLDPMSMLAFYVALACSVQYFGSVVGIYLGVPGETMALISSKVGFNLMIKGQGNACLGSTAIASLIAASFAIVLLYLLVPYGMVLMPLLSAKMQALILVMILAVLIFYGSNRRIVNISLVSLGILLSMIGYNPAGISLTFNSDLLTAGLNPSLVLLMIFVVPNLLRFWNHQISVKSTAIDLRMKASLGWISKRWSSVIRGTLIGSFSGLIPGIGPIISSNIAAQIEQRFSKKPSAELLSAEAANNSAIIICFIPFFALGLTLMAHEAVINDLLVNQNASINFKWLSGTVGSWARFDVTVALIAIANIVAFIIAWPASRSLIMIYRMISYRKLVCFVITVTSGLILYQSYDDLRLETDLMSLLVFLPITMLLIRKKTDTLPLMFSYLLGDSIIKTLLLVKNIM